MRLRDRHLTDRELLLALDRELPQRRQDAVTDHLGRCAGCGERWRRMRCASADVSALYHQDAARSDAHLLSDRPAVPMLAIRAAQRIRSGPDDSRLGPLTASRWVQCGIVFAAIVLFVRLLQPTPSGFHAVDDGLHSIEDGALPVASLTPGATWNLTQAELCADKVYSQRPVSGVVRQAVLKAYGMEQVSPDDYELDYLITPELGGAPEPRNLWPQRYTSRIWNARVKDQLEQLLPRLVCDGRIPLARAQRDIAADWIAAYKKYFGTETPPTRIAFTSADDGDGEAVPGLTYPVWRTPGAPVLVSFPVGH